MNMLVHRSLGHFLLNESPADGSQSGTATTTASGTESATSQAPATEQQTAATEQGQQQAAEQQQQDQAKPATAPESYQFTYPEGYQVDETALGEITGVFKELGLTQEQAQKLVEYDAKRMASANSPEAQQQAAIEHRNAQVAKWEGDLKADKDLGGANFEASIGVAQKALASFGSPALSDMLKTTGLGSHPEVVRFFHKVGKELSEGQLHRTSTDVPAERSLANRMYPNYPA
ncbi:MAG: putative protease [Podoviridae sp. ctdb7]|nr:MAG: putative protease [Podoviridae sp. ctdb7]